MSNPPVIIGSGRIDLAFANATTAHRSYRYLIRSDGLKFFNPEDQTLVDAFTLVEQLLGGQPFGLADTSYARLKIFSRSLSEPFPVTLDHTATQIRLNVGHDAPFGPKRNTVFEALDVTFIESKGASGPALTATGQVIFNFINHRVPLAVELDPTAGLQFDHAGQGGSQPLGITGIGMLTLERLAINRSEADTPRPLILYRFDEGEGEIVYDSAGSQEPINLTIEDPATARWLPGALSVAPERRSTIASPPPTKNSDNPVTRLVRACQSTNELTIEAWIKPANLVQDGPARIVTLSRNTGRRNFTLGQGLWGKAPADLYDVRVRTEETNLNGTPSTTTPAGTLTTELSHVVFTRDQSGQTKIYINGTQQAEGMVEGDFSNWEPERFRLGLANEINGHRPWAGEYYQVAIYNQALNEKQIMANFVPTIAAEGRLNLDGTVGVVAGKTFAVKFDYNLLESTLTAYVDVATAIAPQIRFNSMRLEWHVPPGQADWQPTGQGQINLTIMGRSMNFFSPAS